MTDLENLGLELQSLAQGMRLTVGDAAELRHEVWRITNVQEKLQKIKQTLEKELGFETNKNRVMVVPPWLATAEATFSAGRFFVDSVTGVNAGLVASKFGCPGKEVSLIDVLQGINNLIAWGNWLKRLAKHILDKSELVKRLKTERKSKSLDEQVRKIDEIIAFKLAVGNTQILTGIKMITAVQEQLVQLDQNLAGVILKLNSRKDLIDTIEALVSFWGESVFAIEWMNKEKAYIYSSGQIKSVEDVLQECISLKQRTKALIAQIDNLKFKLEQPFKQKRRKPNLANINPRIVVVATSVLAVIGSVAWIIQPIFSQGQQVLISSDQKSVVATLKTAQTLGMEAAKIVQKPPHSLIVWQQSKAKWYKAIKLLEAIPEGTSVSAQAKKQLVVYRINHAAISKRLITEQKALSNLKAAQNLAMEASVLVQNQPRPPEWQQAKGKWLAAINLLEAIPKGTFASTQAKEKLATYRTNYATISKK